MTTEFAHLSMDGNVSRVTQVTGYGEQGVEDLSRIHDKATRFMEQNGVDAGYLLVDSQTYLNLHAYMRDLLSTDNPRRDYSTIIENLEETTCIQTVAGRLEIIVLPQTRRRLQVIGKNPLWTATSTLVNSNR